MKLTYNDFNHSYYLDGRRCKSVTALAKIPADTYALEQWGKRMVAIGMSLDPNLIENIAVDPDNKDRGNAVVEQALKAAKSHLKADRGTQMHKALECVLLDQQHKLLTEQQRRDADVLRRTLDRYRLRPYDGMVEQFIAWPDHAVTGRFDAILETHDGRVMLTDLKSGQGAIDYPHSTAVQLALYARAPLVSDTVDYDGDKAIVTEWRTMPTHLDMRTAYVLLVPPDADEGTLHTVDIQHGWAAARQALDIVNWRKKGMRWVDGRQICDWVHEVPAEEPATAVYTFADLAEVAESAEELRTLWREAKRSGRFTTDFQNAVTRRLSELGLGIDA